MSSKITAFLAASAIVAGQPTIQGQQPTRLEHRIESVREVAIETEIRAAFDIGSGVTKLVVAEVNPKTKKISILFQKLKDVELRKDLAGNPDGCLSQSIQEVLIRAIQEMQEDVQKEISQRSIAWSAVGTAVFRNAKNSVEFLERVKADTGVAIRIIPQQKEGEIGFATAVAVSGEAAENILSWDSGSGSFQICSMLDDKLEMYGDNFGFIPCLQELFQNRKIPYKLDDSPNPVSAKEALEVIEIIRNKLPAITPWLAENGKRVISIGDNGSIFSISSRVLESTVLTKEALMEAIIRLAESTDDQLSIYGNPHDVMVSLIIAYAFMDHCKFEQVSRFESTGGCEGMLISPEFWLRVIQ